jgi:hypothetical protein
MVFLLVKVEACRISCVDIRNHDEKWGKFEVEVSCREWQRITSSKTKQKEAKTNDLKNQREYLDPRAIRHYMY